MVATTANTSIWFLMLSRWNSRSRRAMVSCQTVTVGRPPGVQQDSLSVTPRKGEASPVRNRKVFVWKTGLWGEKGYGWHYDLMLLVMNFVSLVTGGGTRSRDEHHPA